MDIKTRETFLDISTFPPVHITKFWDFAVTTQSLVTHSTGQLETQGTLAEAFKVGHDSFIFLAEFNNADSGICISATLITSLF